MWEAGPKRGSQQDATRVRTGKIFPRGQKLRGDSMDSLLPTVCIYLMPSGAEVSRRKVVNGCQESCSRVP